MTPEEQNTDIRVEFANDEYLSQEPELKKALESVMERVQDTYKGSMTCDLMLACISISDGVTAKNAKTREKYWRHWADYCK